MPSSALAAAAFSSCIRAKSLTSCVIFIEQNLGPHMLQKWAVLAPSAGGGWAGDCSAVSGSRLRVNWSRQRNSKRARLRAASWSLAAGVALGGAGPVGGGLLGSAADL